MAKTTIGNQDAASLGKALEAMLATAFSPDNFGPFLDKILKIVAESPVTGSGTALAVTLKSGRVRQAFRGFKASDRARLAAGLAPVGAARARFLSEPVRLANRKAGRISALLPGPLADPLAFRSLLGLAAQFVGARLQGEERDAELARERDIAASVKHIEELYLSFPGISIEEISRAVMDEARRMTGSEFGLAGYLTEDRKSLVAAALTRESMGTTPPPGQPVVFDAGFGLIGCVIRKKKPLISNRARTDRRAASKMFSKVSRFLGVPAIVDRRLVGVLTVANPGRDYSPCDLEMVEKLARVYAMVLQRKRAEDARREEDARFRAIISSSKDIIYTVDLKGVITYVSPGVERYGYKPEDLVGLSAVEIAHPDDQDFVAKALARFAQTGQTLPILPYRVRRKDGTYFYAEQKSSLVLHNGRPAYAAGVMRDVTEQRLTELRLKDNEAMMSMVFDTAKDAMFIKDMNGMYVKVNKACAEMMGVSPDEMMGRTDSDFFPPETAAEVFRTDSEVARTGRTLSLNHHRPFPTGTRYVNVIKTPLRNTRGETIGLLGVARDISELKRMESELAIARAADAVSKVARPMAHDFNNALAAINGYATLIADGLNEGSPIRTEISQIIKAVKRAAELTSKFQDFARNPKLEGQGGVDA